MNSFLVLEKSTSSNQFIQSNNEFLNAITCIFKDFPEDLFDKKMYLQFSQDNNIRYITYYDLDQQGYRCAVGKVWITSEVA